MPPTGLGSLFTGIGFGHADETASAANIDVTAQLAGTTGYDQAFHNVFAAKPLSDVKLYTSFEKISIKFTPRMPEPEAQEMDCERDLAVCNRKCEETYGDREVELEEPCKLAVASYFSGGACFPASATVQEQRRGTIRVEDIRVGDELVGEGGNSSRVIALLHDCPKAVALYLRIRHTSTGSTSSGSTSGELLVSPQHLVYVRKRSACSRVAGVSAAASIAGCRKQAEASSNDGPVDCGWAWLPAQDIRPGDELKDSGGVSVSVQAVSRACLQGVHAPLTVNGTLLVDGVLCSCYAPPAEWNVPHSACHVSMMPLRFLDVARSAVESWSKLGGSKEPLLTVEAMWLLPLSSDPTIHPWASGLLRSAHLTQAALQHCRALLPVDEARPKSKPVPVPA